MKNIGEKQVCIEAGGDWRFVNGDWADGADGLLCPPPVAGRHVEDERPGDDSRSGEEGMQAMHWAFNRALCYRDCTVRFEMKLSPHADAGIVLRARDSSHFYLLHFPCCGQACRAQHFWAALSIMDDSGYLRHRKLEMVRRVPSQVGLWLPVEVSLQGCKFAVRIGDYGFFEAEDDTYPGPGCLGVHSTLNASIRNLTVHGEPASFNPWRDGVTQRRNWFYPLPVAESVWQQPIDLKRFPDGELLLLLGVPMSLSQDEDAVTVPHLTRSGDNGRTWSEPEPLKLGDSGKVCAWATPRLHLTPRGRLVAYLPETDHKLLFESTDRGRTWSTPQKSNLHLGPPQEKPAQQISPHGFLNLDDGGQLAFLLTLHPLKDPALNIWTWGSLHCQAYSSRSDDDGLTWSPPVNLDTPGFDAEGKALDGNLDLTEASAIQLAGGRVLAFVRPIYSPWMWETWSDDGGRTWGPCVRGPFPGYAAPNMLRTASGALVIAHRLPALTINLSLDDGLSWDHGVTIDSGLWAMGSMVEVEPDVLLYIYWDTFSGPMRAQYLRITPSGLVPVAP